MIKSSKGSVLSRQKPRRLNRTRSRHFFESYKYLKFALLIVPLILVSLIGAKKFLKDRHSRIETTSRTIPWRVDIQVNADQSLSERKAEEVLRNSRAILQYGTPQELSIIASNIQKLDVFSQVHVIRVNHDRILVSVKPRVPIMCIELDRLRLVSSSGEVYGFADTEGSPACPNIKLTGLRSKNSKVRISDDQTLELDAYQKQIIDDAITLIQSENSKNFRFSILEHREHRGFVAQILGLETEIFLGYPPFDDKLKKLDILLKKISLQGETASRIELDYQGKAFVKLKKL